MNLETIQIVIVAALSVSTILIVIIGIQIIFLLKDVGKIVHRVEKISAGVNSITTFIEHSLSEVGSLTDAGKGILKIVGKIIERKTL
ncbi:MAG TPA: hypothetical protein DHV05_04585 [Acholeplasmataceae bacterium]|nr:hypothetical protein [Acholeplasmataceae bacterium]